MPCGEIADKIEESAKITVARELMIDKFYDSNANIINSEEKPDEDVMLNRIRTVLHSGKIKIGNGEFLEVSCDSFHFDSKDAKTSELLDKAREIAIDLNEEGLPTGGPDVASLVDYFKSTVSEDYSLCKTMPNGIAYHHGKMPMHVRRTLEKAIQQKMITNVVCTTTLIQGVNLPAQNIIIRNPHLYIRRKIF